MHIAYAIMDVELSLCVNEVIRNTETLYESAQAVYDTSHNLCNRHLCSIVYQTMPGPGKGVAWSDDTKQRIEYPGRDAFAEDSLHMDKWHRYYGPFTPSQFLIICKNMHWRKTNLRKLSQINQLLMLFHYITRACGGECTAHHFKMSYARSMDLVNETRDIFNESFEHLVRLPTDAEARYEYKLLKMRGESFPEYTYILDVKHFMILKSGDEAYEKQKYVINCF